MHEDVSHIVSLVLLLFCGFALFSIILLSYVRPRREGRERHVIYGLCLFACGLCSYLYTTGFSGLPSPFLRQIDRAAIFLLIAGTYTPFATRFIFGPFRIRLLYWIWGVAISGVLLRLIVATGYDKIFFALYLTTGWLFLTALPDVMKRIPKVSLIFLGLGALVYSSGAIVFAIDATAWTVTVWHIFVLVAAMLHFVAVVSLDMSGNKEIPAA